MIYFIYGPDTFRARQKLKEIIGAYQKKHPSGLNLRYFEENAKMEEFNGEFWQQSMFKEKKLLVLKNIFSNKDFVQKFIKDYKKISEGQNILIVFQEEKVLKSDPLFKELAKSTKVQEFDFLDGLKLKNWIKKEIEDIGGKADAAFVEKLADFAGNNTWKLSNEIQKLVSYRKKEPLQLKDIELLVKPEIESDIFKSIDALAQRNKKEAINLFKRHLEQGEHPLYLLKMINYQLRNLLVIKEMMDKNYPYAAIVKKTKLHPFVVKKSVWQAQRFDFLELKKIYQRLFMADLNIKTGKLQAETALDLFLANF